MKICLMLLAQQYPVEAESYHGILRRVAGSVDEVFPVAEKLLQLVEHEVAAEAFYPEIEEEGEGGVVAELVGCIVIIPMKQRTVCGCLIWAVVLHLQASGHFKGVPEYFPLEAQLVPAHEHRDIDRRASRYLLV